MPIILDTDHFSILQHNEQPAASVLQSRLAHVPSNEVTVCIVSFQEQTQGWLAYLNRARKPAEILKGFFDLQDLLRHYSARAVVPFDQLAMNEFLKLKRQRVRISTSDLRIAAIAMANRAKLLSRNLRDFRQVPGLDVEDWSV